MAATLVSDTGELASGANRPCWQNSGAASTTARSSQTAAANQSMIADSTGRWTADRSTETTPEAMTIVHDAGGITLVSCIARLASWPGVTGWPGPMDTMAPRS